MEIADFQRTIEQIYFSRDSARGLDGTFRWFVEEVGELARAMRGGRRDALGEEFADVLAWLSTMASICGVQLEEAARKYEGGCPKCGKTPCQCPGG
jgi:NTP pyrophosphatase (non-canonical NTP hydrolase)